MGKNHRQTLLAASLALALVLVSCAPAAAPAPAAPQAPSAPAPAAPQAPAAPAAPAAAPRPTVAASAPAPGAPTPKSGGVLKIGTIANLGNFDMQGEPSINVTMVLAPVYNNLVQYDEETGSKIVPALAESWDVSKDNLTYTFKIRKGVNFHDGKSFAVEDVLYNLDRVRNPPKGFASNLGWILDVVNKVEKVGDDSVRLTLEYPFAPLLTVLAHDYLPMFPKHVVEAKGDMKTTAIGTGPFKLKNYTPSVSLELVKNADYWVKGRPYLDGITFPIIVDRSTYLAALRTGQVHRTGRVFGALSPSEKETIQKNAPDTVFYASPNVISPWVQLNTREGPFKDVRVRKAVSLALDRQAAVKVLAEGAGLLGGVFPTFKAWGYSQNELDKLPGLRQPKDQDLAQAKKLMADAGYPNGFELTVLSRTNKQTRDAATFLTAQLQPLGIQAKVEVLEDALFWDRGRKATFQAMTYTPVDTMPDPHWMSRYYLQGSPLVFTGLNDPKIKDLHEKQVREPDVAKRKAMLQEMERHILTEAVDSIPIVWPFTFISVSPKVKGFTPSISDYVLNRLEAVWLSE
ncbi:MAG: ABC transporter substrate-binding protein [Chloroflexota bacterium]